MTKINNKFWINESFDDAIGKPPNGKILRKVTVTIESP